MRITRNNLLKIAQSTVKQRVRGENDLVSVYLVGSLLNEAPLLGGTTDIDLIFVHNREPGTTREFIRVNDEVHLDILHHTITVYSQPRQLRKDPWVGFALYKNPIVLHDTQHWFDFLQASVTSQFLKPDYILERSQDLLDAARKSWVNLEMTVDPDPGSYFNYLHAIECASNSLVCLTSTPLAERRFLLEYASAVRPLNEISLISDLYHLLGLEEFEPSVMESWFLPWEKAFDAASQLPAAVSAGLHPCRRFYYLQAIKSMMEAEQNQAALWILLHTWSQAIQHLPLESDFHDEWEKILQHLRLGKSDFFDRIKELDTFLDAVEERLENWGFENGATLEFQ